MANLLGKLSDWWLDLSGRDRLILQIAVPVIVLMILFIVVIEPVTKSYFSNRAEYREARETLDWLYDQAGLISRLQNACGQGVFYMQPQDDPLSYARSLARRSSINAEYSDQSGNITINVSNAVGKRMLRFVQTLTCNGYEISDLKIQGVQGQPDKVTANLTVTPRALPRSP